MHADPTATMVADSIDSSMDPGEGAQALTSEQAAGADATFPDDYSAGATNGAVATAAEPTAPSGAAPAGVDAAPQAGPVAPVQPIPPIPFPIIKRAVSGRYRSDGPAWQVELRCDVDGARPLRRVSADYYAVSGATVTYFGSMRVDAPTVSVTSTLVTISGLGVYTWSAGAPRIKITIPRVTIFQAPKPATLQHLTLANAPGATYVCAYAARGFRTVMFEQDRQNTVATPFAAYNTGSLPSGGPARNLSIGAAYAEAGIEMQSTGVTGVVNTAEAGANASWSNAELHAAMQGHFSLWRDLPQWAVWLFHAQLHDIGPSLLGIMFDQAGRQRQGAAVFYEGLAGATADQQRLQLYTCVHELGHCFNLLHSWQKSLASPPGTDRPSSFSWMNYPWRFPTGAAAFWSGFAFQFDNPELAHLRHAFRDQIIMGGNNFAVGAALERPEDWRTAERDDSGLKLELRAPASFRFGEPVSIAITLRALDTRGKRVSAHLKPDYGTVEVAIRKPDGRLTAFRPLLHQCMADETILLDADQPSLTETAFLGYGQDGFPFDHPGRYQLRARYTAPDGSVVLSDILTPRVRTPLTEADEAVADLIFGAEQGVLLALVGSDYEGLARGNDALAQVREEYPDHPLAAYARLAQGVNAAREFKHVAADNTVTVRRPQPEEAMQLLAPVLDMAALREPLAGMAEGTSERLDAARARLTDLAAPDSGLAPGLRAYLQARRTEIAQEVADL